MFTMLDPQFTSVQNWTGTGPALCLKGNPVRCCFNMDFTRGWWWGDWPRFSLPMYKHLLCVVPDLKSLWVTCSSHPCMLLEALLSVIWVIDMGLGWVLRALLRPRVCLSWLVNPQEPLIYFALLSPNFLLYFNQKYIKVSVSTTSTLTALL